MIEAPSSEVAKQSGLSPAIDRWPNSAGCQAVGSFFNSSPIRLRARRQRIEHGFRRPGQRRKAARQLVEPLNVAQHLPARREGCERGCLRQRDDTPGCIERPLREVVRRAQLRQADDERRQEVQLCQVAAGPGTGVESRSPHRAAIAPRPPARATSCPGRRGSAASAGGSFPAAGASATGTAPAPTAASGSRGTRPSTGRVPPRGP